MGFADQYRIGGPRGTAHAAFSLVELMVAAGILMLLAGLVLSSLGRVRVQSEISKSQSHLRQIGVALLAYAYDNDARFPPARAVAPLETQIENPENAAWMSFILPYLGGDTRVLSSSFVARHNPAARDYTISWAAMLPVTPRNRRKEVSILSLARL